MSWCVKIDFHTPIRFAAATTEMRFASARSLHQDRSKRKRIICSDSIQVPRMRLTDSDATSVGRRMGRMLL